MEPLVLPHNKSSSPIPRALVKLCDCGAPKKMLKMVRFTFYWKQREGGMGETYALIPKWRRRKYLGRKNSSVTHYF